MRKIERIITVLVLIALGMATPAVAAVTHTAKAVTRITVVTENSPHSTSSTSFVDLPGALVGINVPAGKFQLVQVRFSGESYCFGSTTLAGNWCSIRILVDGVEMLPNVGSNFAFDSNGAADDFWEGNAMERTLVVRGGAHVIRAQWSVNNAGVSFGLDDWTFTVTQYANGI